MERSAGIARHALADPTKARSFLRHAQRMAALTFHHRSINTWQKKSKQLPFRKPTNHNVIPGLLIDVTGNPPQRKQSAGQFTIHQVFALEVAVFLINPRAKSCAACE